METCIVSPSDSRHEPGRLSPLAQRLVGRGLPRNGQHVWIFKPFAAAWRGCYIIALMTSASVIRWIREAKWPWQRK